MGGRGGKAFATNSARQADAFFGLGSPKGMYPSWHDAISGKEHDALYTYIGSSYTDINNYLRRGIETSSYYKDCIADMTRAISDFSLKKSIVVHRGAEAHIFGGFKTAAQINEMAKKGARLTDKGFMSTSASSGSQFDGKYHFVITVPAGKGRGAYIAPFSRYRSENEFLLQKGSTFKITRAVDRGGQIEVHLRLVTEKKK